MSDFESLWHWINARRGGVVQERSEMNYVFDLIRACDCRYYLEIGSAEGDSLYVFAHAMQKNSVVHYVDLAEPHTQDMRDVVIAEVEKHADVDGFHGNSMDKKNIIDRISMNKYDVVFIDGGHDYETVLSDCKNYAPLATKYVFWHDIQLPEVKRAVDEYMGGKPYETFINSDTYGYAIYKVKND